MPLYTFQCPACRTVRDVFSKAEDTHVVIACDNPKVLLAGDTAGTCELIRLPSAPHVVIPKKHRAA